MLRKRKKTTTVIAIMIPVRGENRKFADSFLLPRIYTSTQKK